MKKQILLTALASLTAANAAVTFTSSDTGAVTQSVTSGDLGESATVTGHGGGGDYINNGGNATSFNQDSGTEAAHVTIGTIEFTLAANGGLGYDLTSVNVFSSWILGRSGQDYKLQFSTDGTNFTDILDVAQAASSAFLSTSVADGGAVIGTGVQAVRIIANNTATSGTGTVFREIDIIGVASVPEPSSTALLGLGGLALILRRRR